MGGEEVGEGGLKGDTRSADSRNFRAKSVDPEFF